MKAALSVALIAFAVLIGAGHPPGALAQGGTEKTSADRIKAATKGGSASAIHGGEGDDLIQFDDSGVGVHTVSGDAGVDTCKCKDFTPDCEIVD